MAARGRYPSTAANHLRALCRPLDLAAAERRVEPLLVREHAGLVGVVLGIRVRRLRVGEDRAVLHALLPALVEAGDHDETRAVGDVRVAGGGLPAVGDHVEGTLAVGAAV